MVSVSQTGLRHYFVDESGDGMLFDRKGRVLLDEPGCPQHFTLGLLEVPDPRALGADLDALRAKVLTDPYLQGVPSMQPESRKTALVFHAKDDLPEVRRDVFNLLLGHDLRYIWPKVSLIHDVDDTRDRPYGEYYDDRKPLTKEVLEERLRI